jgi:FAD/FMN-containing dehydrogenase
MTLPKARATAALFIPEAAETWTKVLSRRKPDPLQMTTSQLSGWGRTFVPGRELRSEDLAGITRGAALSRGLGRSYGDASLPAHGQSTVVGTTLADRILGFDAETGVVRAEAGVCLGDLNRLLLPRGFFTPVTPGTKYVTLGGMVASDVHGKNHHVAGTFGRHVRSLVIRTGLGKVVTCSRYQEQELFLATLGGMGLTGHILEIEVQFSKIPSPWIYEEAETAPNFDIFLEKLNKASENFPMTVSWIDTIASGASMGRGIVFSGRWAEPNEAKQGLPPPRKPIPTIPLPSFVLNRFTMGAFNTLLYNVTPNRRQGLVSPEKFFYPLDRFSKWNQMYGKKGVTQHQCVVPKVKANAATRKMFDLLRDHGACSFLTVLKDCGPEGDGMLSFPKPGISVALDIPIRANTQLVIDKLNEIVIENEGRIYLTKDGFTRAEHFRAMDPRIDAFLEVCKKWDPEGTLRSAQSERIFGTQR